MTYDFTGALNQQFKIVNVTGAEYAIYPVHAPDKALSVNSSKQVVIDTDCNLSSQRWYIYYYDGRYHFVNKRYNSDIMGTTYNSNYVSVARNYDNCCWGLERVPIAYADLMYLSEEDKALMVALQTIYLDQKKENSIYRMDDLIRRMQQIRNKPEYKQKYQGYYDHLMVKYPNIKTTKFQKETVQILTKQNIIDMHNRDSIAVFLASLIPGIGTGFSVLTEIIRQHEQNNKVDILGIAIDTFLGEVIPSETDKPILAGILYSLGGTVGDILQPTGKETYVKNGVRMVEGDACILIELEYELGTYTVAYEFILRNNVVISSKKYGPYDLTEGEGGMHLNLESKIKQWKSEGYVSDPN